MDTRADFQRLLEDMDKVIKRKQQELAELDERLEIAREQLSEKEAKELLSQQESPIVHDEINIKHQEVEDLLHEQKLQYERQIANLNYELIELETANQSLMKSESQLSLELKSSKDANEKLKARLLKLEDDLEEIQGANFDLNIRLAKAESETQLQQKLLRKSNEQDQILLDAFNNKLESLREALAVKDDEIGRLQADNQRALEFFESTSSDNKDGHDYILTNSNGFSSNGMIATGDSSKSKHGLAQIVDLIKQKDAQIEALREQLDQATRGLENTANLFETINEEKITHSSVAKEFEQRHQNDELEKEVLSRCSMLEEELTEKDKQLHLVGKRNRHFETVMPSKIIDLIENLQQTQSRLMIIQGEGVDSVRESQHEPAIIPKLVEHLSELLNEIRTSQELLDTVDQLQRVVSMKDGQIRRLVRELNELNARANQDQIDLPQLDVTSAEEAGIPAIASASTEKVEDGKLLKNDHENASTKLENRVVAQENDLPETQEHDASNQGQLMGTSDKLDANVANMERPGVDPQAAGPGESGEIGNKRETTPLRRQKQGIKPLSSSAAPKSVSTRNQNRMKSNYGGQSNKHNLFKYLVGKRKRAFRTKAKFTIEFRRCKKTTPTARKLEVGSNNIGQTPISQDRLRQLESENQLLELAMKEILLSIQWSDTRCSNILIDCPSLERLCQLIEARHLADNCGEGGLSMGLGIMGSRSADAGQLSETRPSLLTFGQPSCDACETRIEPNLFQFIVMKSELDILRGQNEQLRLDLRLQRKGSEQQQLMSGSSEDQSQLIKRTDANEEDTLDKNKRDISQSDAECQTGTLILMDPAQLQFKQSGTVEDERFSDLGHEPQPSKSKRCQNCSRLVKLANHLLDCIVRIESRVNSSDESYINRLLMLYRLSQKLNQDLLVRDNLINQLRRDIHSLSHQNRSIELRLRSLEGHLEVHNTICPLTYHAPRANQKENRSERNLDKRSPGRNIQMYSTTKDGSGRSVHSLTIKSNQDQIEVPLRDSRVAMSLLQSIIACFQARLDHKDERLNQLEQLLVAR